MIARSGGATIPCFRPWARGVQAGMLDFTLRLRNGAQASSRRLYSNAPVFSRKIDQRKCRERETYARGKFPSSPRKRPGPQA